MKSFATKLLFFALSTLRVKTSFLVPEDLADGVYIVDTKSSVVLAHTAPIANSARNMEHPHNIVACQELPGNTVQCNGYDINGADYDRALIVSNISHLEAKRKKNDFALTMVTQSQGLYNWCNAGNSIPSSQAILYSYGAAVACMCVYFGRQRYVVLFQSTFLSSFIEE